MYMQCIRKYLIAFGLIVIVSACAKQETPYQVEEAPGAQIVYLYRCFDCHGENGISNHTHFPNLAGQNQVYLFHQLQTFKRTALEKNARNLSISRFNQLMSDVSINLSEQEMLDVATYFSNQSCSKIVKHTREMSPTPPKNYTLCAQCHGDEGTSVSGEIPNLASQKKPYLIAQLRAFRAAATGTKDIYIGTSSREHALMNKQAYNLTDREITDLAGYFSSFKCR